MKFSASCYSLSLRAEVERGIYIININLKEE
jgi:hypothetical protein